VKWRRERQVQAVAPSRPMNRTDRKNGVLAGGRAATLSS
jgi:hypothetical protein